MAGNRNSGRHGKPLALHRLTGSYRPSRHAYLAAASGPTLLSDAPPMPDWLPELAQAEWNAIVPQLVELGLLQSFDSAVLISHVLATARLIEAQKVINERGATYAADNGRKYVRPEVKVIAECWKVHKDTSDRLGLSAVARNKVQISPPVTAEQLDPRDDFDRYMEKGDGKQPEATGPQIHQSPAGLLWLMPATEDPHPFQRLLASRRQPSLQDYKLG